MKRLLMIASVPSVIGRFNMHNIQILMSLGYRVDVVCNWNDTSVWDDARVKRFKFELEQKSIKFYQISFSRSVMQFFTHIIAYRDLKNLLKKEKYDVIHCQTPIAGALIRLVTRSKNIKVIYTAHGFHFFKGGSLTSWLFFYPIEKLLSKYTDIMITINEENYQLACAKFKAKKTIKVPGVGVDIKKYQECSVDKKEFRHQLGLSNLDFVILSVGELSDLKNQLTIIKAIHELNIETIKYLIVGSGDYGEELKRYVSKLELNKQVIFLGFREDIPQLCKVADVFAFPSKREGLGLAAIEAMASGLPLLTSNVSGINDYSKDGITGYSLAPTDYKGFANRISDLFNDPLFRKKAGKYNQSKAEKYDYKKVDEVMWEIYSNILDKK